jgi:hypothetical protein
VLQHEVERPPLLAALMLMPLSRPIFLTMSEIVWLRKVRCLRERIMRWDRS